MLFHNPLARHAKTNSDTFMHEPSKWGKKKKVHFLMTLQGCFTFCSLKECGPQRRYCVNTLVRLQCEQQTSTSTDGSGLCGLRDESEVTILVWRSHFWQDALYDCWLSILQTHRSSYKASDSAGGCKQMANYYAFFFFLSPSMPNFHQLTHDSKLACCFKSKDSNVEQKQSVSCIINICNLQPLWHPRLIASIHLLSAQIRAFASRL